MTNEKDLTGFEIAVIGISGRFPGARNIAEFWENLKNGEEAVSFFADEELAEAGVSLEILMNSNYVKAGGILEGIEYFDAFFFDYTPKEAELLDPQIRIFHECAWEGLEDAGYDPVSYDGLIGLYAGATPNHYWEGLARFSGKSNEIGQWASMQLVDKDYLSLRISYKLNLMGPSFSLYTACSTSLVAVHLACQALLNGECDMALAGGVTVTLPKKIGYLYREEMVMSPDGHCRAFDARSSGIVAGNGAALVVLKRLGDALEEKDHIYAVIKGTAINNDGIRKSAFTAPSVEGQVEVIRMALQMAHVEPESISYIEAHGTGTSLGDPIEIEALRLAFNTDKRGLCGIGSVKTNIGHLDSAAGIASLIKTILALKYRLIPPSLHFESSNPTIDFKNSPFFVVKELIPWENDKYPLRAGVSSLGIGGTNAHLVVEEPPETEGGDEENPPARKYNLLLLSAKNKAALEEVTGNLLEYLRENPGVNLADVAYTFQVGRRSFRYRRMLACEDIEQAVESLSSPDLPGVKTSPGKGDKKSVIFVFSGQGSQYVNMGLEIFKTEMVFREEMARCFEILKPIMGCDLKDILYPDIGKRYTAPGQGQLAAGSQAPPIDINHLQIAQPIIFILEYALARMLMRWGIKPSAMIGYSLGEFAAACVAGVFSLPDALKLVVGRARLIQQLPAGAMLSVPLSLEEITLLLNHELSLAIDNGSSCIVAGPVGAVDAFEEQMKAERIICMRVPASRALHTKEVDPILAEFEQILGTLKFHKPKIPYISNVTGDWITEESAVEPGYWSKHLRQTVLFAAGMRRLLNESNSIFVELGPGRDISALAQRHVGSAESGEHHVIHLVRNINQKQSDDYFLLKQLGKLWLYGLPIDWSGFYAGEKRRRISLPTYPFQRKHYWIDVGHFKIERERLLSGQGLQTGSEVGYPSSGGLSPAEVEDDDLVAAKYERPEIDSPYVAATTDTEKVLTRIWQEFFGFRDLGVEDDFFELGGDSLKAISMSGRIYRETNKQISVTDFFKRPTIKELAEYIESIGEEREFSAVQPVEAKEYYRLSPTQMRLYFLQQVDPDSVGYNMWQTLELEEMPDRERFENAFFKLIQRHDSLRTSCEIVDGEPVQLIHKTVDFTIANYDVMKSGDKPEIGGEGGVTNIIENFIRPFDLSQAPLLRVGLIRFEEKRYVLLIDMHHFITDAVSQRTLVVDFMAFYQGEELSRLRLQYKDYSEWQNIRVAEEKSAIEKQEEYWLKRLAGPLPVLNIPTDFPRPRLQSFVGSRLRFNVDRNRLGPLKAIALKEGATLHMLMLAALYILLSRLSGQEDIIIGTPIVGRSHPDLDKIIGVFINTLAQRNCPAKEKTFREFLREVKKNSLDAYENQDCPFDEIVKKLVKKRESSRNPLFDVMFEIQRFEGRADEKTEGKTEKLKIKPYPREVSTTFMDLDWVGREGEEIIYFTIDYCTKLFQRETVEFMVGSYLNLLDSIIDNEEAKIKDLECSPLEKEITLKKEKEFEFNF